MKISILILTITFCSSSFGAQTNAKRAKEKPVSEKSAVEKIENTSYDPALNVIGAGVGTVVGLGVGHPFQGRYQERGWMFTASQVAGLGLMLAGGFMGDCGLDENGNVRECGNQTQRSLGVGLYLGSRVWEIFDLWTHLNKPLNRHVLILLRPQGVNLAWQF